MTYIDVIFPLLKSPKLRNMKRPLDRLVISPKKSDSPFLTILLSLFSTKGLAALQAAQVLEQKLFVFQGPWTYLAFSTWVQRHPLHWVTSSWVWIEEPHSRVLSLLMRLYPDPHSLGKFTLSHLTICSFPFYRVEPQRKFLFSLSTSLWHIPEWNLW